MKFKWFIVVLAAAVVLTGCGNGDKKADTEAGKSGVEVAATEVEKNAAEAEEDGDEIFTYDSQGKIAGLTEKGEKMKEITIPAGQVIGSGPFENSQVEKITFESDEDISIQSAFWGAPELKEVQLPEHLSVIGMDAFAQCTALESITIPAEVTAIDVNAFFDTKEMKEVEFSGNSLKMIEMYAFDTAESLEAIDLPEGLETIGKYAFKGCKSLKSLTIPGTVRSIGAGFIQQSGVKEIHFAEAVELEELYTDLFFAGMEPCTLYIVEGSWMDQNRSKLDETCVNIEYEK